MGSLSLPQPSYDLDFPNHRAGRAFADYVSFIGGDLRDDTRAMGYTEWCESPIRPRYNVHVSAFQTVMHVRTKACKITLPSPSVLGAEDHQRTKCPV